MAEPAPQNYENHRSTDQLLHGIGLVALLAAVCGVIAIGADAARWSGVAAILLGLAVVALCIRARRYTLMAQDRIIRLEMRLRLSKLLQGDLEGKGESLQVSQLIGLRFASDAELPDLVRKVLAENITKADDIKKLVKDWQPDHMRI